MTGTSAPQEGYISVHMKVSGDWTKQFTKLLGCNWDKPVDNAPDGANQRVMLPTAAVKLPLVKFDGPFGAASEDFLHFETIILVGAGIGVTPMASILKYCWYALALN